jgi:hypothetical protein
LHGAIDTTRALPHSIEVHRFARRLAVIFLIFLFSNTGPGLCAGWEATAEARMACCTDEHGSCPMHASSPRQPASTDPDLASAPREHTPARAVTQAEADACCASSERDDARPPAGAAAPALPVQAVADARLVLIPDAGLAVDGWRASVQLPPSQVPRHLLIAVFLI